MMREREVFTELLVRDGSRGLFRQRFAGIENGVRLEPLAWRVLLDDDARHQIERL
jgi:hypothetical protein